MKLELTRLEAFRDRKAGGPTELDGTWVIETGGQVFMFAGDHVRFLHAPGTFQLNLKTEPKQIDVAAELDPGDEDVPGTWYGIYKLEGDKLTIALGATRPTAFDEGAMKFELIREEAPRDKRASDPGETASDLLADDGTRWLQVPGPTWVSSLVASGSRLYAGRRGGVLVSSDFGASWSVVAEGLPSNVVVRALGVRDSTVLVCDRGTIYRTHDGAARWSTVHTEPRSRDLGRPFPLAGSTWLVGARDEIPYTPPHGHPRLGRARTSSLG